MDWVGCEKRAGTEKAGEIGMKLSNLEPLEAHEIIMKLKRYLEEVPPSSEWVVYSGKKGNFRAGVYKNQKGKC